MNTDLLLVVVAGYVVYKIGWVDGWTAVNAFLVLCLAVIAAAAIFRRTGYWKRKKEEMEKARQARRDEEDGPEQ